MRCHTESSTDGWPPQHVHGSLLLLGCWSDQGCCLLRLLLHQHHQSPAPAVAAADSGVSDVSTDCPVVAAAADVGGGPADAGGLHPARWADGDGGAAGLSLP